MEPLITLEEHQKAVSHLEQAIAEKERQLKEIGELLKKKIRGGK